MRRVRGDLLDVMGHQDADRALWIGGDRRQAAQQVLARTEVETGSRLVEDQQLWIGHQCPSDLDALAFSLAEAFRTPARSASPHRRSASRSTALALSMDRYCSRHRPVTA